MKHSPKEWFAATRYWSFPVSTMPVIATFAYLCSRHLVVWGFRSVICLVLSLIGVVLLHSAGNLLSDWFDYRKGVDNEEAYAVTNLVFHRFEPREYLTFSIILFALGICTGIAAVFLSSTRLLAVGAVGVVLTMLYSFLKFNALGDVDIFLIFSVLIICGTSIAITGEIHADALCLALPIGIITVSVLHANNTIDIESDGKAGIKTFAMLLGGKTSSALYVAYMIIPFVCVIASVVAGYLHPLALLCLAAAIPAYRNAKAASGFRTKGIEAMKGMDQASAKLQMVFTGLLSIGLFISAAL